MGRAGLTSVMPQDMGDGWNFLRPCDTWTDAVVSFRSGITKAYRRFSVTNRDVTQ